MKRSISKVPVWLMLVLAFTLATPSPVRAEDSLFDKTSDWFATMGKDGSEKQSILAERRAGRAARRIQEGVTKSARQADKNMKEFGKELERKIN